MPQQVNGQGQITGHSHVVVEALSALDQTTPKNFAFFQDLNSAAVDGILTATVTKSLPAGFYKLSSINTAANYQPVLVPVAQHGSLDDVSTIIFIPLSGSLYQLTRFIQSTVQSNGTPATPSVSSASLAASAPANSIR